jgi:hypothetical protein
VHWFLEFFRDTNSVRQLFGPHPVGKNHVQVVSRCDHEPVNPFPVFEQFPRQAREVVTVRVHQKSLSFDLGPESQVYTLEPTEYQTFVLCRKIEIHFGAKHWVGTWFLRVEGSRV